MENQTRVRLSRRGILGWMILSPCVAACSKTAPTNAPHDPQQRFNGIGVVLVIDAVAGHEMHGVVVQDDRHNSIFSRGTVSRRNRTILAPGGAYVPKAVRVTWGKDRQFDFAHNSWFGGKVLGDYTIQVAERIPDETLTDIRAHGGNLRLKFRLKPDGILLGWDIERAAPLGDVSIFESPGGDFLETRY